MKVIRKVEKEVKKFKIGDQITLGRYTATAMAQDATGTTFCLDQIYGEKPMVYGDQKRIKALYNSKMFDEVRDLMAPVAPMEEGTIDASVFLRSPTAEEIWGKLITSGICPTTIEGADKRWEAMKDIRNRVGFRKKDVGTNYWTDSFINEGGEPLNVVVCFSGDPGAVERDDMECSGFIYFRPVFKLKG